MGRSSNSSHVQLSSNRLISRVHVKARYLPATESEKHKIELECCGWNGAKVLCNGGINEIRKGDTFVSVLEHAEIILDVHDARIRIQWPETEAAASDSDDTEAAFDPNSPTARKRWIERTLKRSPLPANVPRLFPPASPTPANRSFKSFLTERSDNSILQIYEDHSSPRKAKAPEAKEDELPAPKLNLSQSIDRRGSSQFSALNCEQYDSDADAEHDPDEENDPIVHSFGPFGANLSARMASFSAGMSPIKRREEPKERLAPIEEPIAAPIRFSPPPEEKPVPSPTRDADTELMINHVLNQLAFSRLSSTPISVIMNNLPASLKLVSTPSRTDKRTMTLEDLQKLLIATPSIGEIHREGKDAAGKPLESEYYYIAEADTDVHRKAAVEGLRKPSLRACRKQHKVCLHLSRQTEESRLTYLSSNTTGRNRRRHNRIHCGVIDQSIVVDRLVFASQNTLSDMFFSTAVFEYYHSAALSP